MSTAFYTGLRDSTAADLVAQFGRSAVLRKHSSNYNPASGGNTVTSSDTNVVLLTLPVRRGGSTAAPEFSEDQIAKFEQLVLMSAKETAAAGVVPALGDSVIIDGTTNRIVAISALSPAGITVIYKMGVARA